METETIFIIIFLIIIGIIIFFLTRKKEKEWLEFEAQQGLGNNIKKFKILQNRKTGEIKQVPLK